MKKIFLSLVFVAVLSLLVTACGGGGSSVVGDAARGEELYNSLRLGAKSAEGCTSCHSYDATTGDETKAPFTSGQGGRAETRVAGMSAEEYIKESIVNADAYVVEGFYAGDMYQTWGAELSEQEIADLVAYILTEK